MNPRRTFTRAELTAVLDAADRPDLAAGLYSRSLGTRDRAGRSALAFDDDDRPGDLAVVTVVIARLLSPSDGIDFAAATQIGLPDHPDSYRSGHGAWWPGWILDEPTWEEWTDAVNACPDCDDDRCPTHARAPWEPAEAPALVGA